MANANKQAAEQISDARPRTILVSGGTGFVGRALIKQLLAAGHKVIVLTRDPDKANVLFNGAVRSIRNITQLASEEAVDAIVSLAGASIAGGWWTARRQTLLVDSRVNTITALQSWLARATHKPAVWIQASAIGYYGVRPASEALDEHSAAGQGFASRLCQRVEEAVAPIASGVRLVTLRIGLVFDANGGALPQLVLPFRLGVGGRMGSGQQIISWIHLDDLLRIIERALGDHTVVGTYNAVAPDAVAQADFARAVGRQLRRPVWLPVPALLLRSALGELAQLFVDGQRVLPTRLQTAGFAFRYGTLDAALAAALAG
ncbi:TIGR01777 family oxidoreductase [Amantichitinum ursilacus]|uniref:Epimerase family protein n=1 Tax=Amantichitinum ursilacus TaxID=857265 RepID=A0A0N0GQ43_9NEIS|nr:TIGR01777 family oxidoreductase [Amantichitinum ursilacus]KPC54285.1 Epimerase family protein [Amantichitinum ursilacus]